MARRTVSNADRRAALFTRRAERAGVTVGAAYVRPLTRAERITSDRVRAAASRARRNGR